jgi:alpha-beta hydrolase superfamily lysophospholipase
MDVDAAIGQVRPMDAHPQHTDRPRRPWRRVAITALVLVAVFYLGGGWYFSERIRTGGLVPEAPERNYDVSVMKLGDGTVVLAGADAAIDDPGEYGLYWDGGFGMVGHVVAIQGDEVERSFTHVAGSPPPLAPAEVDLDGWYYPKDPSDAGLPFDDVTFEGELGVLRAWYVPSGGSPSTTWAIHVHGWRADRREAIRTLGTFAEAGIDSLVIEYRNDPGAPADPSGLYRFGRTEWADVEAAVGYAAAGGAEQVVLVGYSTGAAAEMAFMERSDLAALATAAVFDAPNLDMGRAVQTEAHRTKLIPGLPFSVPDSLTAMAMLLADVRYDVGWKDIDYVDHEQALAVPALVFHGESDETVPLSVSEDLAATHPDLVHLVVTEGADHVRSWNVDRMRYESELARFLAGL